jgi:FkbM family methyltransferase
MGVKRKVLDLAVGLAKRSIRIAAGQDSPRILAYLSEQIMPVFEQDVGVSKLKFLCPGPLPEYRARTLLTKEPETINWINEFEKREVLWDIGANVGIYSLYAALRDVSVQAFEPAPGNYYLLSKNVELNGMGERISSYCVAFNDNTRLDSFYMSNTDLGGSMSSFGEATDWRGQTYVAKFKQAMIGFTVDEFVERFAPPFPHHIKIDVDGIEKKIIRGARLTLADKRLKSVLVELNTEWTDYAEILALFEAAGLALHKKEHATMFDNTELKAVFNHIFKRA